MNLTRTCMGALALFRRRLQCRPIAKLQLSQHFNHHDVASILEQRVWQKYIRFYAGILLFFSSFFSLFSVLELTLAHFKSTDDCLMSTTLSDYLTLASTMTF